MSQEAMTNTAAVGAVVSPWWLPSLHSVSQIAAEVAPILGAAWLIVQITVKVIDTIEKNKNKNNENSE